MLCQTQVMIDGAELDHHFFSNIQDVALGLILDGFQIFKAQRDGGATCWPLIALNSNLPPDICTYHPSCQSTTMHISLHAFPMHLQSISKALLCTLMHCISDSACYATLHHPLHPCLHTCCLCLFVCLFTFVTGIHVACFVCSFPL